MTKGRGGGKTPERVVELLKTAVSEKSQSAVARESGLALLTVQRYLKGIGEPSNDTMKKLALYFCVTMEYLRGEEEGGVLELLQKISVKVGEMTDMINSGKAYDNPDFLYVLTELGYLTGKHTGITGSHFVCDEINKIYENINSKIVKQIEKSGDN